MAGTCQVTFLVARCHRSNPPLSRIIYQACEITSRPQLANDLWFFKVRVAILMSQAAMKLDFMNIYVQLACYDHYLSSHHITWLLRTLHKRIIRLKFTKFICVSCRYLDNNQLNGSLDFLLDIQMSLQEM
jgi:hypothetical protein